jgi:hypothetical protein
MNPNEKKHKKNINLFMAVGGIAATVGLFATSPELATNVTAQQIGLYSFFIAAAGMGGAFWQWAKEEDQKSGRTLAMEWKDTKEDIGSVVSKVTKAFRDEYPTTPEIEPQINTSLRSVRNKFR